MIKKIDLIINIKEKLYKEVKEFELLLHNKCNDKNIKKYISSLAEQENIIETYFKEIPNINIYINYELFYSDLNMGIASLESCSKIDDDFSYWISHLERVSDYILDEISRTNKMIKYDINTELSSFLNRIIK